MSNEPCFNCKERKLLCHSNCKKYTEWIEFRNEMKKKVYVPITFDKKRVKK